MRELTDREWLVVLASAWSVALGLGLVFLVAWAQFGDLAGDLGIPK
jgi:hypothetical protein